MGLDMYTYTKDETTKQEEVDSLIYWRKHNALHGWFEALWEQKGKPGVDNPETATFNGVELKLELADILRLEKDVKKHNLQGTQGFFFGEDSSADEYQYNKDIAFVALAKNAIIEEKEVYYNSSW
jgi:hypothetical protein